MEEKASFRQALEQLVNMYSKENGSDTPDWILAVYLEDCLAAFDNATMARDKYYSVDTKTKPLVS